MSSRHAQHWQRKAMVVASISLSRPWSLLLLLVLLQLELWQVAERVLETCLRFTPRCCLGTGVHFPNSVEDKPAVELRSAVSGFSAGRRHNVETTVWAYAMRSHPSSGRMWTHLVARRFEAVHCSRLISERAHTRQSAALSGSSPIDTILIDLQ